MQQVTSTESDKHLSKVIKIDTTQIHSHLDSMVRSTVEQTLNGLLDAEAEQLYGAKRQERTSEHAGLDWLLYLAQMLHLSQHEKKTFLSV
jgi:hypothetical protein